MKIKKRKSMIIGGAVATLVLCIVIGAAYNITITPARAEASHRIISKDGELYSASDVFGSKRVNTDNNVKMLFEQKNGYLLVGKGMKQSRGGSEQMGSTELHLMKDDGTEIRKVTDAPVERAFFNARQDKLYYETADKDVYESDVASGQGRLVASKVILPSVSNDGTKMVYTKMPDSWKPTPYTEGAQGIAIRDIRTGSERLVTHNSQDYAPIVSPDGKYVLYSSGNEYGVNSLYLTDIDGSHKTQLTNIGQKTFASNSIPGISDSMLWSADGKYFVFESDRQIWVCVIDLDSRKLISAYPVAYGINPAWVEDGKTISVVSTENQGGAALTVVDITKGTTKQ